MSHRSLKIDLHVHTKVSPDGFSSPKCIIKAALKRGLSGIAVTDHNTNEGVAAVRAVAPPGFVIIPGVEYSTDCGHVLALFCELFFENTQRDEKGRFQLAELAPKVHHYKGVLVAAHPFSRRDVLPDILLDHVDGLEMLNAREWSRDAMSPNRVAEQARNSAKFTTGGSDAHWPAEIGKTYTVFPDNMDLKEALLSGLCHAEGRPGFGFYRALSKVGRRLKR